MTHSPTITFKRGDTFKLEIAVIDKNSLGALSALATLVISQAAYQAALIADPVVPQDVADTLAQQILDQAAYDLALVVDITGWTVTSKLMWCGQEIAVFTVTIVSAIDGTLTVVALPNVTILWNPREHEQDITFVTPDGTTSSENIIINVVKGATNG